MRIRLSVNGLGLAAYLGSSSLTAAQAPLAAGLDVCTMADVAELAEIQVALSDFRAAARRTIARVLGVQLDR